MNVNWRLILVALILPSPNLFAQHTDLVDSTQSQVLADSGKSYMVPDVLGRRTKWANGGNRLFTYQLGAAPILDYNAIWQDDESIDQVGAQESRLDLRSGRVSVRGKLKFRQPWQYLLSLEYKGLDRGEDDPAFGITDLKFVIPAGKQAQFVVGKIKETFSYEMVGDAANLPHQERLLNPFFNSRNIGAIYRRFLLNDRMTVSAGWFNNWFTDNQKFNESANTFTARVTGIPKWEMDGKRFVHVGVAVRYTEAENGVIRLKGKNELNIGSNYVDTKEMPASHQWNFGIEQLWSLENFSVLMEYAHNWTTTTQGVEQFNGYYVTTSYIIGGDERPYDKRAAYARRVLPDGKGGAWELVGRIGRVDLDGRKVLGGINNKYTFGVNWWATQFWKMGAFYGISNLRRDGLVGISNNLQIRLQWIY